MDQLITIKDFLSPTEASMMHSILEAEDIYSFLKDENSVIMTPYLANAIGGIKLQVKESDAEKAVAVLKEAGYFQEETKPEGSWIKEHGVPLILLLVFLLLLALYQISLH